MWDMALGAAESARVRRSMIRVKIMEIQGETRLFTLLDAQSTGRAAVT